MDNLGNVFCLALLGGFIGGVGGFMFFCTKILDVINNIEKLENDIETLKFQVGALHAQYYQPFQDEV